MDEYWDVTVVVGGALQRSETVGSQDEVDALLLEEERAAAGEDERTEVYVLHHPHTLSTEDCSCGQYATDHAPERVFGGADA